VRRSGGDQLKARVEVAEESAVGHARARTDLPDGGARVSDVGQGVDGGIEELADRFLAPFLLRAMRDPTPGVGTSVCFHMRPRLTHLRSDRN